MIQFLPSRSVALALGQFEIHWYGIMYMIGFLIGLWLLPKLLQYRKLTLSERQKESLFLCVFLGVLFGGRIGYVFFYGGTFYLEHPAEIFAVWHGGMSSHGGFLGVFFALLYFAKKNHIKFFALLDVLVVPIAIGLALGRLGNLINAELYGTVTNLPWAVSFPNVEGLRHPTQVYAMLKDVFIAAVCFLHLRSSKGSTKRVGETTSVFLVLYSLLRFIVEFFRDQQQEPIAMLGILLSRGQLLTIPLFILGVLFYVRRHRAGVWG